MGEFASASALYNSVLRLFLKNHSLNQERELKDILKYETRSVQVVYDYIQFQNCARNSTFLFL